MAALQVRQVRQAALQEPPVLELARQRQEPERWVPQARERARVPRVSQSQELRVRQEWMAPRAPLAQERLVPLA